MKLLKLDLGCGDNCRPGYQGVDIAPLPQVRHVVDLFQFPWPFRDASVKAVWSSHFVEHIPADLYKLDGGHLIRHDGWITFMNELWRIMASPSQAEFVYPHLWSNRAFQDPTHRQFIPPERWFYGNAQWRKVNKLDHYLIECDFEVAQIDYAGIHPNLETRSPEAQMQAATFDVNVISDVRVILKKA